MSCCFPTGFCTGCCPARGSCVCGKSKITNCVPTVSGKRYPCFDDGILFRIVTKKGEWFYANDTTTDEITITATFGPDSNLAALSTAVQLHRSPSNEWVATAKLLPLQTIGFVRGTVNGFSGKYQTAPAPQAYFDEIEAKSRLKCQNEMNAIIEYTEKKKKAGETRLKFERRVLSHCRRKGIPYVDLHFPPDLSSVYRSHESTTFPQAEMKKLYFQRPHDYVPPAQKSEVCLYGTLSIKPSNIEQGQLGDCWFMCSIATLAEHTGRIRGLFSHPSCWVCIQNNEQKVGGYRVTLNYNGWFVTTVVDDYLPRVNKPATSSLCEKWYFGRSRTTKTELWVPLVEKAYAKIHGSYAALTGGDPMNALQDLTGAPVYSFAELWRKAVDDYNVADKLFKAMHKYKERGYLVAIYTPTNAKDSYAAGNAGATSATQFEGFYKSAGLDTGHAYSVLDVSYFPLSKLCLMKIRNPWGGGAEWSGDWSDNSDKWSKYPFVKLACRPKKKNDGTFWMEWNDVKRFFDGGCVCYREAGWYDYRVRGAFSGTTPLLALEVNVKKETKMFISLQQADRRGMEKTSADYSYNSVLLAVSKSVNPLEPKQQTIHFNSDVDPDEPTSTYVYQPARCVSMCVTLVKEHSPYYIIPRSMRPQTSGSVRSKYVIALSSEREVGSNLKINFKHIDSSCRIFQNVSAFDVGTTSLQESVYQTRSAGKAFPKTYEGTGFHDGKEIKE